MLMQSSTNKPALRLLACLFSGLLGFLLLWPSPLNAGNPSASKDKRQKTSASGKVKAKKNKG
ncbi:MAG: hypothetical protein FJ134_08885 [Deltaproteobacteria bacterium]|nr:hypothetical protein [Deltaproteobacteria bacterium]